MAQAAQVFDSIDKNHDDKITREEFMSMSPEQAQELLRSMNLGSMSGSMSQVPQSSYMVAPGPSIGTVPSPTASGAFDVSTSSATAATNPIAAAAAAAGAGSVAASAAALAAAASKAAPPGTVTLPPGTASNAQVSYGMAMPPPTAGVPPPTGVQVPYGGSYNSLLPQSQGGSIQLGAAPPQTGPVPPPTGYAVAAGEPTALSGMYALPPTGSAPPATGVFASGGEYALPPPTGAAPPATGVFASGGQYALPPPTGSAAFGSMCGAPPTAGEPTTIPSVQFAPPPPATSGSAAFGSMCGAPPTAGEPITIPAGQFAPPPPATSSLSAYGPGAMGYVLPAPAPPATTGAAFGGAPPATVTSPPPAVPATSGAAFGSGQYGTAPAAGPFSIGTGQYGTAPPASASFTCGAAGAPTSQLSPDVIQSPQNPPPLGAATGGLAYQQTPLAEPSAHQLSQIHASRYGSIAAAPASSYVSPPVTAGPPPSTYTPAAPLPVGGPGSRLPVSSNPIQTLPPVTIQAPEKPAPAASAAPPPEPPTATAPPPPKKSEVTFAAPPPATPPPAAPASTTIQAPEKWSPMKEAAYKTSYVKDVPKDAYPRGDVLLSAMRIFEKIDQNQDGYISRSEFERLVPSAQRQLYLVLKNRGTEEECPLM